MATRVRVGVLYGGESVEHGSSFLCGLSVIQGLDPARFDVVPLPIDTAGRWAGGLRGLDAVFPVLFGTYGEDGTIQGFLEVVGVPYVGAGVLASALGMDKIAAKRAFRGAGLPVLPDVVVEPGESVDALAARIAGAFGFPVMVKPARSGSSVGISAARAASELGAGLARARAVSPRVLVEPALACDDVECAVLALGGARAILSAGRVARAGEGFYDFEAKFRVGGARIAPEDLPRAREIAERAVVEVLDARGLSRADLLLDPRDGALHLSEVNTMPGIGASSNAVKLLEAAGVEYRALLGRLVDDALARGRERMDLRRAIAGELDKASFVAFALSGSRALSAPWWLGQAAKALGKLDRARALLGLGRR